MKKIVKALVIVTMAIGITLMSVSCGEAKTNENFDHVLNYFQNSIVVKEQALIRCEITSNDNGYVVTYSYVEQNVTYVAIITFNQECEIVKYDVYGDGQYVNNTK